MGGWLEECGCRLSAAHSKLRQLILDSWCSECKGGLQSNALNLAGGCRSCYTDLLYTVLGELLWLLWFLWFLGLCCGIVVTEGFPSGQRDQTVNLTRKLRWFESTPLHHGYGGGCGADDRLIPVGNGGNSRSCGSGHAGIVQRLEPQPSKLMMRVRLPLPASSG